MYLRLFKCFYLELYPVTIVTIYFRQVRFNKVLCICILGIWSLSLTQFTMVLTAAKARRDQSGVLPRAQQGKRDTNGGCCAADVHGILISILLQDLPFLCLRLLLIFKYHVLSYTNMFFTSKNTLVIILLLYRLIVVYIERHTGEDVNYVAYDPTRHSRYLHSDTLSIPESYTGSSASKSQLLKSQVVNGSTVYGTQERIYQLRQEKHKWGKAYHFHEINSPM